ncbi:DUF72 domain-containing protein [Dermatobacter hominis]|uniref:DUF72 domain-containing protein n=1 Tax=Dermatobacter hominis TaxID=2884263 RepID=UPI001D10CE4D|nr:DUF72 domain-containing protein [Dermatobacter hominis]UDY37458.1 DUF72 domain-containing protein [Dermatobacter hominis]
MLRVGTSGWQYRSWREAFYGGRPTSGWLAAYAATFGTVEVNSSFYRLPERHTVAHWAEATPDDFCFVLKVSRYLTHVRRLRDPEEPIERFLDRAEPLGPKLGAALLQLPPDFRIDVDRLAAVLERWPADVPLAVELRHDSWFVDEVRSLLGERSVPLVRTDRDGRPQEPAWVTADWCYVRLHEGTARPRPCYGDRALRSWRDRIVDGWGTGARGFAFFNNDPQACAPRNAVRFRELASAAGVDVG